MSLDKLKFESMQRDIQNELLKLKEEEESLFQDMNNMLNQKLFLDTKIKGLAKLVPTLKVVKHEAQDLVSTINDISESSEKISGKIRSLDAARVCKTCCQNFGIKIVCRVASVSVNIVSVTSLTWKYVHKVFKLPFWNQTMRRGLLMCTDSSQLISLYCKELQLMLKMFLGCSSLSEHFRMLQVSYKL
jgi:hypothetical protein